VAQQQKLIMPVIGDTSELPLPDLLGMLRFRTGIVLFNRVKRIPEIEMHVVPGYVRGMFCGGKSVTDEAAMLDKVVAVAASSTGQFAFHPRRPDQVQNSVKMSMDGVILSVVTMIDEILYYKDQLPRMEQLYSFVQQESEFELEEEDHSLLNFVKSARDFLEIGSSAEDIAAVLQIGVAQVQFYLLKLRSMGIVSPMRSLDPFLHDPALCLKSSDIKLSQMHPTMVSLSRSRGGYRSSFSEMWNIHLPDAEQPMPSAGRIAALW